MHGSYLLTLLNNKNINEVNIQLKKLGEWGGGGK